jgi:hypothetical protein
MHRIDPATGAEMRITPQGLTIGSAEGNWRFVPAPEGYRLSHFEADGSVVAHGVREVDGWWDWHFILEDGALRRGAPAY